MKDLPVPWELVEGCLKQFPGLAPAKVKGFQRFLEEGSAKKGVHFFLVEFAPGEVVMPQGVYSDYAGILLEGSVRVYAEPQRREGLDPRSSCWRRRGPWARTLANWVLDRTDRAAAPATGWWRLGTLLARGLRPFVRSPIAREKVLSRPYETDTAPANAAAPVGTLDAAALPLVDRALGVTSAVWNLPRSVTLVAGRDAADPVPCRFLLVKRYTLKEIIKESPAFYQKKMEEFVGTVLPHLLGANSLFWTTLYIESVAPGQWPRLLDVLRGTAPCALPGFGERLRGVVSPACKKLLDELAGVEPHDHDRPEDDPHRAPKYRLIKELNRVLKRSDFYDSGDWPPGPQGPPTSEDEYRAWNLRLFEAAFPGVLRQPVDVHPLTGRPHHPITLAAAQAFIKDLTAALMGDGVKLVPEEFEEGDAICKVGDPADAFYLILTGKFRVSRAGPGGSMVVNHLGAPGYFGEACITEGAVRSSTVAALTRGVLVKVPAELLRPLLQRHPALEQKLQCERRRIRDRDRLAESLSRLPPRDPPERIAGKLLRATNLLLIDMEKCTRCDQCVRSCGEAHDDVPRFHRANPELRFGKWEVAGACLHCIDAPCQSVCPVGAITLLDTRAVQIHRDRCIGCTQCAYACPFHVIDMYKPAIPEEAPALSKKNPDVATKCDLCLTADRDPPCVAGCPYDAAHRGAPETFFPDLANWAVFDETEG